MTPKSGIVGIGIVGIQVVGWREGPIMLAGTWFEGARGSIWDMPPDRKKPIVDTRGAVWERSGAPKIWYADARGQVWLADPE